jgi:hypothetical protein
MTVTMSDPCQWAHDVAYALAIGLGATADEAREGFGWRVIPHNESGAQFWESWKRDKGAMKAKGYRVTRTDAGDWLVSCLPRMTAAREL